MAQKRAAEAGDHAREDDPNGHQQGVSQRRHQTRDRVSFYTVPEVAQHLGVSTRTVCRWIKARQLVAHHFGRAVRISESDLRAFLAARRAT